MRKIILMVMVVGMSVFIGGCGGNTKTDSPGPVVQAAKDLYKDSCSLLKNEYQLKYYPNDTSLDVGWKYAFDDNDYRNASSGINANFKMNEVGKSIDFTPEFISLKSILEFCEKITKNEKYDKGENQKNTFASLKITYSFDNDLKKFVAIYEPIILKLKTKTNYDIIPVSNDKYISDGNGNFKLITEPLLNTLVKNYAGTNYSGEDGKINIKHPKDPNDDGKFINNNSLDKGDIKYCIMPMQQIIRMYIKNKTANDCSILKNEDLLSINFVANDYYKTDKVKSNNHKMHIVVYATSSNNLKAPISNLGEGADFGQLSPPNYAYVNFENGLF